MKKNIVKLEWYDPTMVLSVPGEEADCLEANNATANTK